MKVALRTSRALAIAATALVLSSCTHPVADTRPARAVAGPASPAVPPLRLAQVGYGDQADFIQCTPPQCPARTLKTLGPAPIASPTEAVVETAVPVLAPAAAQESPPAADSFSATAPPAATQNQTWSVGFAFGSAQLDSSLNALEQIASELPATGSITIAGRTDDTGPAAVNDALAKARADTVRDYLVRERPELTITVEAAGKCCFAAANDTAAGRALNRRVEITLQTQGPGPYLPP